jgi:hypothetical protein
VPVVIFTTPWAVEEINGFHHKVTHTPYTEFRGRKSSGDPDGSVKVRTIDVCALIRISLKYCLYRMSIGVPGPDRDDGISGVELADPVPIKRTECAMVGYF